MAICMLRSMSLIYRTATTRFARTMTTISRLPINVAKRIRSQPSNEIFQIYALMSVTIRMRCCSRRVQKLESPETLSSFYRQYCTSACSDFLSESSILLNLDGRLDSLRCRSVPDSWNGQLKRSGVQERIRSSYAIQDSMIRNFQGKSESNVRMYFLTVQGLKIVRSFVVDRGGKN